MKFIVCKRDLVGGGGACCCLRNTGVLVSIGLPCHDMLYMLYMDVGILFQLHAKLGHLVEFSYVPFLWATLFW